MNKYARLAKSKNHKIINIERPFSNFNFTREKFGEGFFPVKRIMSEVRVNGGRTMVWEEIDISSSKELAEENDDITTRSGTDVDSRVVRLSFFNTQIESIDQVTNFTDADYIGYAVIKEDTFGGEVKIRIFESLISYKKPNDDYIHGARIHTCRCHGKLFKIRGYIYCQQNNISNVCAHVALKTVMSRFENADLSYAEMNKMIGIDHIDRKAGGVDGKGMSIEEMEKILETAGIKTVPADYRHSPNKNRPPFQKYIYASIESGYPAIIVFETSPGNEGCSYHAIPVFGHSFNENTWVPSAETSYFRVGKTKYIPSESWVSMYIGHDDNFGSNYSIPRHYLHTRGKSRELSQSKKPRAPVPGRVAHVIATFPKPVKLTPVQAEIIGMNYLFELFKNLPASDNIWRRRLEIYAKHSLIVIRPFLIKKNQYISHLTRLKSWDGDRELNKLEKYGSVIKDNLPDQYYWMIELSIPELFSANKRKIGEVLLRAEINMSDTMDFKSFSLARLPGYFIGFNKGTGPKDSTFEFIPNELDGHVQLYGCE